MTRFAGLYLTGLGFFITASSRPGALPVRIVCLALGCALYTAVRSLRGRTWRAGAFAAAGILLMLANLAVSERVFGARSWLTLFGVTFQPSELLKVCAAVSCGALIEEKSCAGAGLYAAACALTLAAINDFGGALVMTLAYLSAAGVTALSASLCALGAVTALSAPHVAARLKAWGNAWDDAFGAGYQQARAMAAVASGGLFGCGFGAGALKAVAAADTDMAFALLCEEGGLFTGALAALAVIFLSLTAAKKGAPARMAGAVLAAQAALNIAGSLDFLPFTGITFPFISRGGTSLIASWGLLALMEEENIETLHVSAPCRSGAHGGALLRRGGLCVAGERVGRLGRGARRRT